MIPVRARLLVLIPFLLGAQACQAMLQAIPGDVEIPATLAMPTARPTATAPAVTSTRVPVATVAIATPTATLSPAPTTEIAILPSLTPEESNSPTPQAPTNLGATIVSTLTMKLPPTQMAQALDTGISQTLAVSATTPISPSKELQASPLQLKIFEQLWKIIKDDYLYRDYHGLPWDMVHSVYRYKVEAGLSDADFYDLMSQMVALLGDSHSHFFSPQANSQESTTFAGKNDFVGIGILTNGIPERKHMTVMAVFPGSPAEEAGLQPHDILLDADSKPFFDANGNLQDNLRGPEGTPVILTVQTPGQEPRPMVITRRRVTGSVPVPYRLLVTPRGKNVGYIMVPTFNDSSINIKVGKALQAMSSKVQLQGVIVDVRMNSGGASDVLLNTLDYFTHGLLGSVTFQGEDYPMGVDGTDIGGSQHVPMVVLANHDSASAAEIFSGILKDLGRAYLIGEPTSGNVELLSSYDLAGGASAWIAVGRFRPVRHPNDDWEHVGVAPDMTVMTLWDQCTESTDPLIKDGLDYFDRK